MRLLLAPANCDVLEAHSGGEALSALREGQKAGYEVELVRLDTMMPGMDGYAVIVRTKAAPQLCNTSFIVTRALDSVRGKTWTRGSSDCQAEDGGAGNCRGGWADALD